MEPQNVSRAFVESNTNSSGVRNKRFLEDEKVAVWTKSLGITWRSFILSQLYSGDQDGRKVKFHMSHIRKIEVSFLTN